MSSIRYIDENLVWNDKDEVYAYYELLPYNYSFLSLQQKQAIHESFQQLVAQIREGNIHALQIATETSVRTMQEHAKALIKGKLKESTLQRLDEQTEHLVKVLGDVQVDYRFFIGFRLIPVEEEINVQNVKESVMMTVKRFIYGVNHHMMEDFVKMPKDEIRRYAGLERLLENKISKRFRIRRMNKDDFGYLIEHIYARISGAYETYEYHLPMEKTDTEHRIKSYDLLRPMECLMEEKQRYLKIAHDGQDCVYVSYFTISAVVGELNFPSSEIFYYQQQVFDFPIDTSVNIEIVSNRKALRIVRNKKKELKDMDDHAYNSGNDTSGNVVEAMDAVDELETELDMTKEAIYKMSYLVRVSAPNLEELHRRCDEVKNFYDDMSIKLVRPVGDMYGFHKEFLPSGKRHIDDYVQYIRSDFLASLGFGTTQQLGDRSGFYLGFSPSSGKNVYVQPWLAAQGIKGTVTNALSCAFVGSLGGGKSFSNNLFVLYSVLFGAKALIIDPKAERGKWKEYLPEIAEEINVINLTAEEENRGLLDPFVIMQDIKDAESLAIEILTFMTGISSRDAKRFPVLRKAIRCVAEQERRGLLHVIEALKKEDTQTAKEIAEHIESFTDYNFASLLFSDGDVHNGICLDRELNIVQIADLVLPDKAKGLEEYTTIELLSVGMLIIISTYALDFIHSDRGIFKMVDLDEAWALLNVAQGKTLSNNLSREGRSMNSAVCFITQSSKDIAKEDLKDHIGMKFAFRCTDIDEIKATLEFFGLDQEDEGNQKVLRNLENGQCLFQDNYGNTGVLQVDVVFQDLFDAFDTRPPLMRGGDGHEV